MTVRSAVEVFLDFRSSGGNWRGHIYSQFSTYKKLLLLSLTWLNMRCSPFWWFDKGLKVHHPPGIRFRRKQCFTNASPLCSPHHICEWSTLMQLFHFLDMDDTKVSKRIISYSALCAIFWESNPGCGWSAQSIPCVPQKAHIRNQLC